MPILPCGKIPLTEQHTSSIIAVRTGDDNEGVIGLSQTGAAGRVRAGAQRPLMGIDERAIISYLVTAYCSTAVLVPHAVGVRENVEVRPRA
ncbi:hypothetical protein [Streptomyces sp. MB09-01]|uniref:hypothetical protein n=1 Tax=Streptomyces sp. MB09-01 TaxID=3028666 RepID=UPI003A5C615B